MSTPALFKKIFLVGNVHKSSLWWIIGSRNVIIRVAFLSFRRPPVRTRSHGYDDFWQQQVPHTTDVGSFQERLERDANCDKSDSWRTRGTFFGLCRAVFLFIPIDCLTHPMLNILKNVWIDWVLDSYKIAVLVCWCPNGCRFWCWWFDWVACADLQKGGLQTGKFIPSFLDLIIFFRKLFISGDRIR